MIGCRNGIYVGNSYDLDAVAIFDRAAALGGNQPSEVNKLLISDFMVAAKAAGGGNLSGYLDIQMFMNDATGSGLVPFDRVHWNNPSATLAVAINTPQKNVKKGYSCGTGLDGAILSKTFLDTSIGANKTDIGVLWVWFGIQNIGIRGSGVSIGTSSRAIIVYPKYTATNGFIGMGGESEYAVSDGDAIIHGEITNDSGVFRRRVYVNNTQHGSAPTTSWGADFNAEFGHLGLVITPPSGMGTGSINVNTMILGGFILYRPSIVNRTALYNAVVTYRTGVLALP